MPNADQQVKAKYQIYKTHVDEIVAAFIKNLEAVTEEFKPKLKRAFLAEDDEHKQNLEKEYQDKVTALKTELKTYLERTDKRFLKYAESLVESVEQADELASLKKELSEI